MGWDPNQQRWYAKWKLIWNKYTLRTRFCTFGAGLYAQSVLLKQYFRVRDHLEVY